MSNQKSIGNGQRSLQENAILGEVGEGRSRLLLIKFFEKVSPEASTRSRSPDGGIDVDARWLRSDADHDPRAFHFQVKTQTASRHIKVDRNAFEKWQTLSKTEPVFLLYYGDEDTPKEDVRFLAWQEWVIRNAPTHRALASEFHTFSIDVDKDFKPVGPRCVDFHRALQDELNRAKGVPGALFRTVPGSIALPVDLNFLLQHLEAAAHVWLPAPVLKEIPFGAGHEAVIQYFLRAWRDDETVGPNLRSLVESIKRTCSPIAKSFERLQFGLFVDAMIQFQKPTTRAAVSLPRFNARTIRCWRCFAAYFPESMHVFMHLAQHGCYNDQLFSLVILPVPVVASGPSVTLIAEPIANALRRLRAELGEIRSLEGYMLAREARRGIIEAGCAEGGEERETLDFMNRHSSEGWELQFLSLYGGGWEGNGAIRKAELKLTEGTLRDVHTLGFHAWMHDQLPAMLRSVANRE